MAIFATTYFGLPASTPTLTDLMDKWIAETENQSVLSLDNQGETGPAAVGAMCLQVAKNYIAGLSIFSPPPPDATMQTALPYQARIVFEAGFVAQQQWSAATYSNNIAGTIARAMSDAQSAVTAPPPPPVTGPRVGACYNGPGGTVCMPGPGSTLQNTVNGQTYQNIGGDGNSYVAHIGMGLPGMTEMWFTPAGS